MVPILIGLAGMVLIGLLFWYNLPRDGKFSRVVNTVFEPYLAIAVACGMVISIGAVVIGVADLYF